MLAVSCHKDGQTDLLKMWLSLPSPLIQNELDVTSFAFPKNALYCNCELFPQMDGWDPSTMMEPSMNTSDAEVSQEEEGVEGLDEYEVRFAYHNIVLQWN